MYRILFAVILIVALLVSLAPPASLEAAGPQLVCRTNARGYCECYIRNTRGVGLGWRARPALWCKLAGVS